MSKVKKISVLLFAVLIMVIFASCKNSETIESDATVNNATVDNATVSELTNLENNSSKVIDTEATNVEESEQQGDITILYTNDIHGYIDNVTTDEEGNLTGDGLRFSKIAAMLQDYRALGDTVLVDAGDELQGSVYGAMDEGATIVDLMGATGYDLATPGNHDFDYGVLRLLRLAETSKFPYISCNFHPTDGEDIIFEKTKIFDMAGKKVAFVGVTTPYTITSSTPVYFQNEKGEFIYDIDGTKNPNDLYDSVQRAIDSVRADADYVIGIGHIGVDRDALISGTASTDIISHVSGLDAFIDGHSHTMMEGDLVKDIDGKDVILTQTGNYLSAVGVMTISPDGTITTKLVNDYDREDETVAAMEQKWIRDVNDQLGDKIGTLDSALYICNPDNEKQRLVRAREMNSGDFVADSYYWYFNEEIQIDCDVVIVNGGSIRAKIEPGDFTYLNAKQIEPFGNMICLISATGQQIVDALEMGVTEVGEWNEEWDSPAENGGFLQVAGLSYTIDASIPTSLVKDDTGMFKAVSGDYKVKDVKVYNKEKGVYEPIDLAKEYNLGGINYTLRNGGDGLNMFDGDPLVIDYVGQDYIILSEYIKSFAKVGDYPKVNTANSPLASYEGYLLNYEEPTGSGRIQIIMP